MSSEGKNYDLFCIKKWNTGSHTTEVHVLSAASGYKTYILQTGTCFPESGPEWQFMVTDSKDLVGIKRSGTGSGKTEVHIASAASNYQEFVLQTGTALAQTDESWFFCLAPPPSKNIFCIKRHATGSKTTEIHVLNAANNYQSFVLQTGTGLHETDANFDFLIHPNGDFTAIKMSNTGSGKTEVHTLSAASGYKTFTLHQGTDLRQTNTHGFEFCLADTGDIFAIEKAGADSGTTEIHALSAKSQYKTVAYQANTGLHPTDDTWSICMTA